MSGGLQCAICLDNLKTPVVTPCGHMQCEACLKAHITASKDPIKAICPTCRTPFPVVSPDLEFVPRKYHMFINPSIRRVYIDLPDDQVEDLKDEVARLESSVASLRRDKALLMDRCESSMAASSKHAEGEKVARQEAQAARKELENMKRKYEAMKKKYQDLKLQ
ncbi:hypothetical protein DENSPDRAFT_849377 [Dentipellis sp. KUC8613]|nr:hypothetical protein DENSPDRAFT_849377 [Dentipellis sp. KUC8613]